MILTFLNTTKEKFLKKNNNCTMCKNVKNSPGKSGKMHYEIKFINIIWGIPLKLLYPRRSPQNSIMQSCSSKLTSWTVTVTSRNIVIFRNFISGQMYFKTFKLLPRTLTFNKRHKVLIFVLFWRSNVGKQVSCK